MSENYSPKPSKNTTILLVMLGVVAALLVLLIISTNLAAEEPDELETPPSGNLQTGDTQTETPPPAVSHNDKVSGISLYKGPTLQYNIKYDAAIDEYLLEGFEHMLYNDKFELVISTAANLSPMTTIEDPNPAEEYGVTPETASYTLVATDKDGNQKTVYIGAPTISGDGYYYKNADEDAILCASNSIANLFVDKNTMLSGQLADPLEAAKYHLTEKFTVYKDMKPQVSVRLVPEEERENGDAYGYYEMTYPEGGHRVSDYAYDAALKSLICPMADSVVTTELTEENFVKYGLKSPSYVVEYTLDGKTRNLYFGNRTDDGSMIYVMSEYGFIGLAVVADHFAFLDNELIDYVNPFPYGFNIKVLSSLEVSGKDFSHKYILSEDKENLTVTEESSGKTIETQNFRNFYRDLLMLEMRDYAQKRTQENLILTTVIETVDGKTYEYKYYYTAERECYYTINGVGEFYMDISDIEKVISDASKLYSGETINPDVDF